MRIFRPAICLALIIVSVLASSAFAARPSTSPAGSSAAAGAANPDDVRWDDRFAMEFGRRFGTDNWAELSTSAVFQGELYVAGNFQESYEKDALRTVARWNGRQWKPVSTHNWTSSNGLSIFITDLVVHEGNLYATGQFGLAGVAANIARWDGQTWEALGEGLNGVGYALASYGGDLYAAGQFTRAGGVAAEGMARWDGAEWHAVGAGLQMDSNTPAQLVNALVATPQGLYAGGGFGRSGNQPLHSLALWNGSQWSAPILDLRGQVYALEWHDGGLYAAGTLSIQGAVPSSGSLLRWDGTAGEFLSAGLSAGTVARVVRSVGGELYASAMEKLYRWNGVAWEPFGRPLAAAGYPIRDMIGYNNSLHVVGTMACQPADCAAKYALAWTGDNWNGLGEGVFSQGVSDVALIGDAVYVSSGSAWGGSEQILGSQRSRSLGRRDTAGWHDASGGGYDRVTSLLMADGSLYAARAVYNYDGSTSYYTSTIDRLDGEVWTKLPGVFRGVVNTLAYADGNLYVGGTFSWVGNLWTRAVARWDGATWAALGEVQLSEVQALAVQDGAVYVAGITGPNQGYAAVYRWNGAAWAMLGKAYGGNVEDIAVAPSGDLYIAGQFGFIDNGQATVQATLVARWRAGAWQGLPHDFQPSPSVGAYQAGMYALEFGSDGSLYLGGLFASAGNPAIKSIARYDGSWHALGSGVDGVVLDLESSGGDLYVGGRLTRAGDKQSANVAIWHGPNPSTVFLPLLVR